VQTRGSGILAALAVAAAAACSRSAPDGNRSAVADAVDTAWPTIDDARFLTAADVAAVCHVEPDALQLSVLPRPTPFIDALGEERGLFGAKVRRARSSVDAHPVAHPTIGIVVEARDRAAAAAQSHDGLALVQTPVPGTRMRTYRFGRNGWVRREVHGLQDRYVYNLFETDAATARADVLCDDAELIELARLVERRLPPIPAATALTSAPAR
jgi:hypothetical protein